MIKGKLWRDAGGGERSWLVKWSKWPQWSREPWGAGGGLHNGCEGGKGGRCRGSPFGPGGGGGPGGPFPEGPPWGRGGHLRFGGMPPPLSFSLLIHSMSENVGLAGSRTPNHKGV